jgi:hypothetical protein
MYNEGTVMRKQVTTFLICFGPGWSQQAIAQPPANPGMGGPNSFFGAVGATFFIGGFLCLILDHIGESLNVYAWPGTRLFWKLLMIAAFVGTFVLFFFII